MAKKAIEKIVVQKFSFGQIRVRIVGTAPLICNNIATAILPDSVDEDGNYIYDDKSIRDAGRKRSADKKFQDTTYRQLGHDGKPVSFEEACEKRLFAFPHQAFKKAMVNMGNKAITAAKTDLSGYLFVVPEQLENGIVSEFATLDADPPVRWSTFVKDPPCCRHRARFNKWATTIVIRYPEHAFDPPSIINALSAAGMFCGVGDYRPEKIKGVGGSFGTWEIDPEGMAVFHDGTWNDFALPL